MELLSTAIISLISLVILVPLLSRKWRPRCKEGRPPGPWCLPFVGSLFHLLTSQPQAALRDLAVKHGPVMYLRLGQVDTVVISSAAAAQEVLRDNDLAFASRPRLRAIEICGYGCIDVVFSPYGAYWRTIRKICVTKLLCAGKVRQFAPIRDSETMALVRDVRSTGRGGEPVNLGGLLVSCTNAIARRAAFGEGCGRELQEQFLSALDVVVKSSTGFCVRDLFPSLWFLDVVTGLERRLWRARRQLDAVFDKIIAECQAQLEQKTGDDNLVSAMLRIRDEGELEAPFTTTSIKAVIGDMFAGGTDTSSSATEWLMSELIRNPESMAKAQAEVRQTFEGISPQDHEAHMEKLVYIKMAIKESMRLHPVLPLLVPHFCRETCNVGGFKVTEGSRVIVNAWAMARSPDYWHDAEEFRPERFEHSAADYNGTLFQYIPFGAGRRRCPGDTFGLAVVELLVARLLYYFDWTLPNGMKPDELDMDMTVGATARRTNQLHLVASPYKKDLEI